MTPPTTIVIADDHVLVREGLKMLLGAEPDLEVVADTGDGAAVEALVRKLLPGLLVLDLELPGKSGIEVAAAIKADASLAACKVLVLTGNLKAETVSRALAAGADGYVVKSEDADELLRGVRAVLAGHAYVSRQIAGAFAAGGGAVGAGRSALAQITPREKGCALARGPRLRQRRHRRPARHQRPHRAHPPPAPDGKARPARRGRRSPRAR